MSQRQAYPSRNIVIFDMDGVLASNDHVIHHVKGGGEPDWQAFNDGLLHCEPNKGWITLAAMLYHAGNYIVILTNRSEQLQNITLRWLSLHRVMYDLLIMRPPGTPYLGAKEARLERLRSLGPIVLAVEDDPEHCKMYQAKGIPTLYAHSGYFADGLTPGVETADTTS